MLRCFSWRMRAREIVQNHILGLLGLFSSLLLSSPPLSCSVLFPPLLSCPQFPLLSILLLFTPLLSTLFLFTLLYSYPLSSSPLFSIFFSIPLTSLSSPSFLSTSYRNSATYMTFPSHTISYFLLTKTSNVQYTNVSERRTKGEALVDLSDYVIKQLGVECFGQGISCCSNLFFGQRHPVDHNTIY